MYTKSGIKMPIVLSGSAAKVATESKKQKKESKNWKIQLKIPKPKLPFGLGEKSDPEEKS